MPRTSDQQNRNTRAGSLCTVDIIPDLLNLCSWIDRMFITSAMERELVTAERDLCDLLMRMLPLCAEHGTMIFFNSQNLPDGYRQHWLPKECDEMFDLANRCVSIRRSLGLTNSDTLGQLFLDACAENANMQNPHRRGPRKLATWLLAEVRSRFDVSPK